ncbi:hypothetical protein GCM10009093_25470 [Brevundimonas terrae]|uniref:Carboxypeptidase regulatory-like domain-containing protein n=1 Tax=Brevundimonas terrae TaxID=363631 RepID=A0ABN0YJJ7_9CAUL
MQGVIALLGMVIVMACVTILVLESLRGGDEARLSARVLDTAPIEGGRQLIVQVDNKGERTASDVTVTTETSGEIVQAVIDYVPARGNRRAVMHVPAEGVVQITVESWIDP